MNANNAASVLVYVKVYRRTKECVPSDRLDLIRYRLGLVREQALFWKRISYLLFRIGLANCLPIL